MTQPTAVPRRRRVRPCHIRSCAGEGNCPRRLRVGRRMPSSFRRRRVLRLAAPARPAMFGDRVPLGDAPEGRCAEVGEVLQLKEGTVIRTCRFESAQQLQPNQTHWRAIVGPVRTGCVLRTSGQRNHLAVHSITFASCSPSAVAPDLIKSPLSEEVTLACCRGMAKLTRRGCCLDRVLRNSSSQMSGGRLS